MDRLTAAQVFVQVAERGSMAAAAHALEMSRAMVTRYMAQMEAWAGARLLHRTTRRQSLTAAGEHALARCRRMLEIADEVVMAPQDDAAPLRGLLRVACAQSLAQAALVPALGPFLQAHPQVAVDLRIDSRAVHLVEDGIDLAIRITNDLDPNIVARRLGDCESVVCAAPAYLAAHGTPRGVQDLALHNCLAYSYFSRSLWEFTDAQGQPASVPVGGNLSANESQVLLAAALEGIGIVHQPRYAVAPALASGALQALLPGWQPAPLGIHGLYATRRQMTAALRALLDTLAAHFANPAWAGPAGTSASAPRSAARRRDGSTAVEAARSGSQADRQRGRIQP